MKKIIFLFLLVFMTLSMNGKTQSFLNDKDKVTIGLKVTDNFELSYGNNHSKKILSSHKNDDDVKNDKKNDDTAANILSSFLLKLAMTILGMLMIFLILIIFFYFVFVFFVFLY